MSRRDPRPTMDYCHRVKINTWIREGLLRAIGSSWQTLLSNGVTLDFKYTGNAVKLTNRAGDILTVNIVPRRCGPDSWRQHFNCPQCRTCVDVLLVVSYANFENGLGCRHCLGLVYGSTRDNDAGRALRRVHALRERAGFPPGIVSQNPRPKGIHWRTYMRHIARHNALLIRYSRTPHLASLTAQVSADIQARDAVPELLLEALRRLPENEADTWAALEAFEDRYRHLRFDLEVAEKIAAAIPPRPPDPPRIHGGTGTQRRYSPPRPASRRCRGAKRAYALFAHPRDLVSGTRHRGSIPNEGERLASKRISCTTEMQ